MEIQRYGLILNVERFDECVAFYRDLFGLKVMFSRNDGDFRLTCLEFGTGYLMIETDGHAVDGGKDMASCPSKLRFHVEDLESALARVRRYGVQAEITRNDWGSSIDLHDPDGNRIGIRDESGFVDSLGG